jgi:serine/threonine protein kinase
MCSADKDEQLNIVMEYAANGSLHELIRVSSTPQQGLQLLQQLHT